MSPIKYSYLLFVLLEHRGIEEVVAIKSDLKVLLIAKVIEFD